MTMSMTSHIIDCFPCMMHTYMHVPVYTYIDQHDVIFTSVIVKKSQQHTCKHLFKVYTLTINLYRMHCKLSPLLNFLICQNYFKVKFFVCPKGSFWKTSMDIIISENYIMLINIATGTRMCVCIHARKTVNNMLKKFSFLCINQIINFAIMC